LRDKRKKGVKQYIRLKLHYFDLLHNKSTHQATFIYKRPWTWIRIYCNMGIYRRNRWPWRCICMYYAIHYNFAEFVRSG